MLSFFSPPPFFQLFPADPAKPAHTKYIYPCEPHIKCALPLTQHLASPQTLCARMIIHTQKSNEITRQDEVITLSLSRALTLSLHKDQFIVFFKMSN